jgi:NTP pyrophosphatase (non-canonical NTP hydrolase)
VSEHFNGLDPAEAERLTMLIEECGEVIQAATKILRHGFASYNPKDPNSPSNRVALRKEIEDVQAIIFAMERAHDVNPDFNFIERWQAKLKYTHYQGAAAQDCTG